jgi:hypothetical protein
MSTFATQPLSQSNPKHQSALTTLETVWRPKRPYQLPPAHAFSHELNVRAWDDTEGIDFTKTAPVNHAAVLGEKSMKETRTAFQRKQGFHIQVFADVD